MRKVLITLDAPALAALRARVSELQARLGAPARLTEAGYLRYALLLDLQRCSRSREDAHARQAKTREDAAVQLLWQFDRVWRAVAALAYKRCRGAVPIDDLRDAAREEALKACRRANGKGSPAALIRVWASFGVKALLKERIGLSQYKLIYPDGDERSRWDVLEEGSAPSDECAGSREALQKLQELLGALPSTQRKALRLTVQGLDDDAVAERTGHSASEVVALRAHLAQQLAAYGIRPDAELTVPAAAALLGKTTTVVGKMIQSGKLAATRRGGQWFVRESDVMTIRRAKEAA